MAKPFNWRFQQLGGKKLVKTLTGWSAPFGRPRRGPIVNAGVHVGTQATTFADGTRTVHMFGVEGKPFELSGRWMDAAIGTAGGAQAMWREWKDFVSDRQEIRATWGPIISYRIVIEDLDLNYESAAEIAWTLKAIVLEDEADPMPAYSNTGKVTPAQNVAALEIFMLDTREPFNVLTSTGLGGILNQVSDAFDSIVSDMNAPFAAIYDTASALTSFETALSADLQKMGAGLQSLRTSALQMRDLNELLVSQAYQQSTELGTATANVQGGLFSGPDMLQLTAAKSSADVATTNMLTLIVEMQNEIDRRLRGKGVTAHAAQDGDTWEKIALQALGSPGGARKIRQMNGIRYGKKPQPGRLYTIPKGT